ncbi:RagB/SusD family nutrient uptake outer membrane protein [Spirosoma agri]|uniref:RagB/SusD family nutrient uptake outer membrane protein n=1 Tax=Spirosoma agri TaxID=1987381 RepID=A0A6M0IPN9_9BACT|nr:RagB/SusD family nutrient uptake outer membrane protein [Spirosoma agri]
MIRWKAGRLIQNSETTLSMKLTPALRKAYEAAGVNLSGIVLNADNYILIYPNITARTWSDKLYLFSLPLQELNLNAKLLPQNPGW